MPKMLIVYYSRTGNTAQMAEEVATGAREVDGVEVTVKPVAKVQPHELKEYDGIIMGSPVYYGTMAAELKKVIDESVVFHGQLDGKVGAAFASSGWPHGGNETTVLDIVKALLVHGMIVQGSYEGDHYGAVAVGAPDQRAANEGHRLGRRAAELVVRLFGK